MPARTRNAIAGEVQMIQSIAQEVMEETIETTGILTIKRVKSQIEETINDIRRMMMAGELNDDELKTLMDIRIGMGRQLKKCEAKLESCPEPATPVQATSRFSNLKREEIPTFDGNPLNWPRFWTMFRDLVWDNPAVNDPKEKVRRLWSSVPDQVRRLLPGTESSTVDLVQIEREIQQEFADPLKKQIAFMELINRVGSFRRVNDNNGWLEIERVAKLVKNHYPTEDAEHLKSVQLLAQKLPTLEGRSFLSGREFNADALIDLCQRNLRANERSLPITTNEPNLIHPNRPPQRDYDRQRRVNVATRFDRACAFCKSAHPSAECMLSLADRRLLISTNKRCYLCLERFSYGHECGAIDLCHTCPRPHSLLIGCETQQNRIPRRNAQSNRNNERAAFVPAAAIPEPTASTSSFNANAAQSGMAPDRYAPTVCVQVECRDRTKRVRALLDGCSDVSYVTRACAERLNARIVDNGVALTAAFNSPLQDGPDKITELRIRSIISQDNVLATFHLVESISKGRYLAPSKDIQRWMADRGFILTDTDDNEEPEMLIGNDILEEYVFTGQRERIAPRLWAKETHFGWCVVGTEIPSSKRGQTNVHRCNLVANQSRCVCADMKAIFDADHLFQPETDQDWLSEYSETIRFDKKQKRYIVRLPWQRHGKDGLFNNYESARAQARSLQGRLQRNGGLQQYNEAIQAYVPEHAETCGPPTDKSYYIPHHSVIKEESSTKIRIVFNCSSAKLNSKSLNQCLYKGNIINKDVRPMLIRFRLAKQVATADLVKAFLQIIVDPEDRDYLRYLWFDKNNKLTSFRMKAVLFGATSSPAILGAVLKKHSNAIAERYPRAAEILATAAYMDDLVVALADDEQNIQDVLNELKMALGEASFQMHKIHTNSDTQSEVPCLGIRWITVQDQIRLTSKGKLPPGPSTREAASFLASFYDPLGLVLPISMEGRRIMRSLSKADWDAKLDEGKTARMFVLKEQYDEILQHQFRRSPAAEKTNVCHIFGDASKEALCAAAYMELTNNHLFLIIARGRLAPEKSTETIPLLEIKAAFMAAQLSKTIKKIFPKTEVVMYSDSTITLARLATPDVNKYPHNLAQWIIKINELTADDTWRYVPTNLNPADIGTRTSNWKTLKKQHLWWHGPSLDEIKKANDRPTETSEIADPAIRTVLVTTTNHPDSGPTPHQTLGLEVATNQGFVSRFLKKVEARFGYMERVNDGKTLKLELAQFAEVQVLKNVQRLQFPEGLGAKAIQDKAPFLDEWGLIRLRKRLDLADLEESARCPVVVKFHPSIKKMARSIHESILHAGVDTTFEQMSQGLHVIGGRKLVRDIVRKCFHCNRIRGKPFDTPSGPLPPFRVNHTSRAFDVVGVDAFGPILICKSQKYYGLLLTCATTRAVHLELIDNLKATSIFNALKRFIATRGSPTEIHSDNAKYFKTTSANLRKIIESCRQETEKGLPKIRWIYQPPRAPWWGGFFERMIGTVKRYLTSATWRKTLTPDELATLLKQVEAIVNSRPLVRLDEGVLTPAHFFAGSSLLDFAPFQITRPAEQNVLKQHNRLQSLLRHFWKRWTHTYLQQLRTFHHDVNHRQPTVGELVAVMDDLKPRYEWLIAQIQQLHPGPDGRTRVATVRTLDKRILTRAIKLLIPLEATRTNETRGTPLGAPEDVAE